MIHLYLMQRVDGKGWKSRLLRLNEVKIGISEKPQNRERQVDKATPGKVELIFDRPVWWARSREKRLHRMFKDKKFVPGGVKRGGGREEWVRVNDLELMTLYGWVWWWFIQDQICKVSLWIMAIAAVVYCLLITLKIDVWNGLF